MRIDVTGSGRRRVAGTLALAMVALACGPSEPPLPPAPVLEVAAGAGQDAFANITLPERLVVRATLAGAPAVGARVSWTVLEGAGTLTADSVTDATGQARGTYTAGPAAGAYRVAARLVDVPTSAPVTFTGTIGAVVEPPLVATFAVPQTFGLHDMSVRDGLAFLAAWNAGLMIVDVGDGRKGGSPANPQLVGTALTNAAPLTTRSVHNAWWFHNPVRNEKRYVFVGQEGPGIVGATSAGDIHVVDVSDMANPVEVAFFHLDGAGTHNFWMDEPAQVLYAAYYNGGVVALDVSGVLAGNLANRLIANVKARPDSTYVWSVQLANGRLYASDMLTGVWQLSPQTLQPVAGGNNVPDRFGSDFWVHGTHVYSGPWGAAARNGNRGDVAKIWSLGGTGVPTLVDSVKIAGVQTISDVEVSADGKLLMLTTERGFGTVGAYFYALTNPVKPRLVGRALVAQGVHTGTFARINGRLYAFLATNAPGSGLVVYDVTALAP